jgi:hypothetical protein
LAAFDLDGSGIQSVLVTDYDAKLLQIFKWKGGQFEKTAEVPTLSQPVGLAVGSTRADGGGTLFAAVADYGANRLSLFPLVNGGVGDRVDITVSGNPVQAAVGNLDGTGENSIAVADLTSDKIDLLKRPSSAAPGDLTAYQVVQTISLPAGSSPSALAAVDLNGDGKTDLVVADFESSQLSVFLQQKDGSLEALPAIATSGLHPNGLTVADLKGDGQKEIVVANRDSDSLDIFQWVNGTFQLLQTLTVVSGAVSSFGPVDVAALDTRHQGVLDLAVSHMRSNSVQVLAQGLTVSGGTPTPTPDAAVTLTGSSFSKETTYAFPNPATGGQVNFNFDLSAPTRVRMQVFEITGKEVWSKTLEASQTQAGVNQLSWDLSNNAGQGLASGLYLYRVSAGDLSFTRKLAILH